MNKNLGFAAALALALSPAAFAAKAKSHCVSADGSEVSAQTKKECKKAGGKWKKMKKGETSSTAPAPK
jgi:hypothetical protein